MPFGYANRRRTYKPRTTRFKRGTRPPRRVARKSAFVKRVSRIAKSVHSRSVERKWRGETEIWDAKPWFGGAETSLNVIRCYTSKKGVANSERIGKDIMSSSVKLRMALVNNFDHIMFMRILLLEAKQGGPAFPDQSNIMIDIETKNIQTLTKTQNDIISRVDHDFWKVHMDRTYTLYPRGSSGATTISGMTNYARNISIYHRRPVKLSYEQNTSVPVAQLPVNNDMSWVMILGYPIGISVPIIEPPFGVNFTNESYHYYKDL